MAKVKIIKELYGNLVKEYKFPAFDEVNQDLEIIALDPEKCGIFLNACVRILHGKLQQFLGFMDPFLAPQPNSTYTMVVFRGLTDEKRKEIMKDYKKLVVLYQEGLAVNLKGADEKADYFKKVWKVYPKHKKNMINLLGDLNEIFLKEEKKVKVGYMG